MFFFSCFDVIVDVVVFLQEKEREIEVKQLPPTSQQSVKSSEQETEKGNVNIPVSRG